MLTPKQQRFVAEYLLDLNAAAAARRCGYSARAARQQGDRLLSKADIQAAIAEAQAERAERVELTQDEVVRSLQRIGRKAEAVADFPVALRALELLGRHLGMFPSKVDMAGRFTVNLVNDFP